MDLAEADLHPDRMVPIWGTEAALAAYTKRTGRIVSASSPMAGGLLKALLRRILYPPDNDLRRDQHGNYVGRRPNREEGVKEEAASRAQTGAGGGAKKKTKV